MKKIIMFFMLFALPVSAIAEGIAVVDLQQVVSASPQVRQLKSEHAKQISSLEEIIVNARGEIANEKDTAKILLLEEKYTKEFNTKKALLEKEYESKLSAIEKNIKSKILEKAKSDNYDVVFAKSVVLYGGKDITSEIIQAASKN